MLAVTAATRMEAAAVAALQPQEAILEAAMAVTEELVPLAQFLARQPNTLVVAVAEDTLAQLTA
jgi:enamine deaminase RidA (YjgF/YER057c/UK114 family)